MTTEKAKRWKEPIAWVFSFALIYICVSFVAFRLHHPWMTETQVLMHTPDALLWRILKRD